MSSAVPNSPVTAPSTVSTKASSQVGASQTGPAVTGELGTADDIADLLATLRAELDEPTHYDQHRLCKRWGRPATSMADFLGKLRDAGFEASRTHYGGTTFKTTADVTEIREATGDAEESG